MKQTSESCSCVGLVEYSEETTFHGIKYVFKPQQSIFQRAFWILILPTLFLTLGYFVHMSVSRYIQFPLKMQQNAQFTFLFEIPFPAITICPANKIQNFDIMPNVNINKLGAEFWQTKHGVRLIMSTQICQKLVSDALSKMTNSTSLNSFHNSTIPTEFNTKMIKELFQMSPSLLDTIRECQLANWHDEKIAVMSNANAEKLFAKIITNEGVCFTFNTVPDILQPNLTEPYTFHYKGNYVRNGWDPENGYSVHEAFPFKAIVRGNNQQNGLSVILSAKLAGRSELCSPINLGYKLVLHSPTEYPSTYENFIPLEYGTDYMIAVKPETISTGNNLRSIRQEFRQCYFNDERQLKYYKFYNENNCKLECYANYSLKMFGGFPFSAPRDKNTPLRLLKSYNYGWHLPNYYGLVYEYTKMFNNSIFLNETFDMNCNCLPECNSIRYDYEIISENVNIRDPGRTENNPFNVSETLLEIIFEQPTFSGKERIREYSFAALVSDFGGLLGLFMGGSLISVFELIYFLVVRDLNKTYYAS